MNTIYLDHNATTPLLPQALDAMLPWLRGGSGNPSSGHAVGRAARQAIDQARQQVASLIGAHADEIIFTSGGTESSNLAILGSTTRAISSAQRRGVLSSTIEHPATAAPCAWLQSQGYELTRVGVDPLGLLDLDAARQALSSQVCLVTVMLANNETGAVQPVAQLAQAAHQHGASVHTDAAQAVGKMPVDVDSLGVDLLSIAGHKLYGPKGIGALFCRRGTPLGPLLLGAGHEGGRRPGTENVAGIVGLGAACAHAQQDLDEQSQRQSQLRDHLWQSLAQGIDGLVRNGPTDRALSNTLNVSLPGLRGADILSHAPTLAASTGSACHEGVDRPSAVLSAMGLSRTRALGSLRLSLGRSTTAEQVQVAAAALIAAVAELRAI